MYVHVFVVFLIIVLYNGNDTNAGYVKLPKDIKAIMRCAPRSVYHQFIQYIQHGTFTGITKLDMSQCNITNLTPGTFNFQAFIKVKILRLNKNRISRLPSDIFHSSPLFNLEKLYLDQNRISYLSPKQFVYLSKLNRLGLSHNEIKNIQSGIFTTNPLVRLGLSFNYLENLPGDLFVGNTSASLKILQLKHNRLTDIPPCLFQSNASEGIFPKLEVLDLSYNNIKELPTELFNSTNWSSLRKLHLQRNRLTGLPPRMFFPSYLENVTKNDLTKNLKKWTIESKTILNLEYLSLARNQIISISPKQFFNLPKLNYLDLSVNKIKYLEPGIFTLNSLITLSLSGNMLKSMPGNLFSGNISTTLRVLLLKSNLLTEVPQCLYQSNVTKALFSNLEVLDLCQNNIQDFPTGLFNSTSWSSLKRIYMCHNNISSLPHGIFDSLYLHSLAIIDLSYNNLKTMPSYLFKNPALSNLKKLRFSYNQIDFLPQELFCSPYLQNVIVVELSNNRIKSVPVNFFKNLANVETICLDHNNIKNFSHMMLPKQMHHLCFLDLSHNKITSTGDLIKRVIRNFQFLNSTKCKLDLSYNGLVVQQTNFFPLSTGPKQQRFQIRGILNLSYNKISKFEVAKCETMPFFSIHVLRKRDWLHIQGNKVFSVVNLVKAALQIDLNHMELGSACLNATKLLTPIEMHRLIILIKVFMYDYDCNCDMLKYLELQSSKYFDKAARKYLHYSNFWDKHAFTRFKCGSPEHLRGKFLFQIKPIELQCEHSKCTHSKMCTCTETPFNSTIRINCTETKIKLMQPFIKQNFSKVEIYMGFNGIYKIPIPNINMSMYVILLDLSFNYITNIPCRFFYYYPNITHLNLAGNQLTTIPSIDEWNIINSLRIVELRENNFTCNCSGLQMKATFVWLNARQNTSVEQLNQIKCSWPSSVKDKVIYNLPDSLFGCPFINLVLVLTLTLSLLLFISIVSFIAYFFRYYISLFLFIHCGWRFCYSYTQDETTYDSFISYSCKDSDWVINQLVNPLENLNPPYNLCLHERDFLVGVPICDNITKAIEGSKCTVCVVSKNWLESDWCQFEFRVAHCLATVEKKTRLLVILKEEIPNDKIKGDLKFYMKTFTYLDAASPLFWSRLLNDLPRPDDQEVREENDQRDDIELM